MDLLNGLYGFKDEVNVIAENLVDLVAGDSLTMNRRAKAEAIKDAALTILGVPNVKKLRAEEEAEELAELERAAEALQDEINRAHRAEKEVAPGTVVTYSGRAEKEVAPGTVASHTLRANSKARAPQFEGMGEAHQGDTVLSIITVLFQKNSFIESISLHVGDEEVIFDAHRRAQTIGPDQVAIFSTNQEPEYTYRKLITLE